MDLEALVGALGGRDDGGVANQGVVDTGVWHQVGLELVQIDVESTVEAQRRGDGADNLGDQAVEVIEARTRNVEVAAADVVDGLVVDKECTVCILDGAVGRQNGVVRLNDSSRDSGSRVDGELELALFAVLCSDTLEQQRTKTRTGATSEGVEDQEALK